jgi:hypothetical protein
MGGNDTTLFDDLLFFGEQGEPADEGGGAGEMEQEEDPVVTRLTALQKRLAEARTHVWLEIGIKNEEKKLIFMLI